MTICKTVNFVKDHIVDKADDWIKFPSTVQDINNANLNWQTRFNLTTVVGALDSTDVEIKKLSLSGDKYINKKGYPSIND